jgi:tRNA(Ile)-lysidine synthase
MPPTPSDVADHLEASLGDGWVSGTLVVAWSGGLDSTVLLDLADRIGHESGLEVAAVHVHHHTRASADADAAFCRRIATRRGLPLFVEDLDPVRDSASLEAQLRRQRYAAIGEAAERLEADLVVTGHHADDAVETALMRFIRGTGTEGLANLSRRRAHRSADAPGPVASWPGIALSRPLLACRRDELRQYAESRSLDWRRDPTNRSTDHTRNRIRQRVVPELEKEAGSLAPMLRTLDNVADDADALSTRADRLFERIRRPNPSFGSVALETDRLAELASSETTALLRHAGRELPSPPRWTRNQLREAVEAIREVDAGDTNHRRVTIGGAVLIVEPAHTVFVRTRERGGRELADRRAIPREISITEPNTIQWFDHRLRLEPIAPDDPEDFPDSAAVAWFDAAPLPDTLQLRGPGPGESFQAIGKQGQMALSEVLRDGDVPRSTRWRWPCLAHSPSKENEPGDCLWVCGLRQSRRAAVSTETDHVLEVEWETATSPMD